MKMPQETQPKVPPIPNLIKVFAQAQRWQIAHALMRSDYRVQELAALLGQPTNLVSHHLKALREAGLVESRRSEADGRDIYNILLIEQLQAQYVQLAQALHLVPPTVPASLSPAQDAPPLRLLFLCTRNSARSQMAEGIARDLLGAGVRVESAGNDPAPVHPLAIAAMKERGIDISQQRSSHIDHISGQHFDFVITVCDRARESCPVFPGDYENLHWSIPDPVASSGDNHYPDFQRAAATLERRIIFFLTMLGALLGPDAD